MREVIIEPRIKQFLTRKTNFFEGWFKFINLGPTLDMVLKFYTSMAKELKLKVRRFWGLITTLVEVTGRKLVGDFFARQIE